MLLLPSAFKNRRNSETKNYWTFPLALMSLLLTQFSSYKVCFALECFFFFKSVPWDRKSHFLIRAPGPDNAS